MQGSKEVRGRQREASATYGSDPLEDERAEDVPTGICPGALKLPGQGSPVA